MILLLDTHALLWWLAGDPQLNGDAVESIASPTNDVLVSAASIWEIEIKRALGRLRVPDSYVDAIERSALASLPILVSDAVRAGRLPRHHADPFDRMLVAQAIRLDAVIITRDRAFGPYGVPVLAA